mgnify:FL=1
MEDRQTTPDFTEGSTITRGEINEISQGLLEDVDNILNEVIGIQYPSYDQNEEEWLKHEVLIELYYY